MLNVIIIDDEQESITSLKWDLNNFKNLLNIDKTFTDPYQAIEYLNQNNVNLIFLDIEMPAMDGFEFLDHFENRNFEVVFVTAYDQYAIKAIKSNAFDYILKPVDQDELDEVVKKINNEFQKNNVNDHLEDKIQIATDQNIKLLDPYSILYCKSDGNYCHIYFNDDTSLLISKKLKYMEEKLDNFPFMRVHNSYVVNLNAIKAIDKKDTLLIMTDESLIPVSRSKKDKLFSMF